LDPLNWSTFENQALLFALQGRFEQALDQLMDLEEKDPGRLTVALALSRAWARSGDNQKALDYARLAVERAAESPLALAALVDKNLRIGNSDQAQEELVRLNEFASNNETAITTNMLFYLMTGDIEALDELATSRLEGFIDNDSLAGTGLLIERVRWAAMARLAMGDAQGARELFAKGIPEPTELDPTPSSIHTLALFARAVNLDGDPEAALEIAKVAIQLGERVVAQGWGDSQLNYALAAVAASSGSVTLALDHLRDAIDAGWDDFVFADHDPALAEIVQLSEFMDMHNAVSSQ
jgi:tetratricopeptide (TPR) repeat protein